MAWLLCCGEHRGTACRAKQNIKMHLKLVSNCLSTSSPADQTKFSWKPWPDMFGNQGAKKKSSSLLAFLLQRLPYSLEALPKHSSFMCLVAHLTHCKHGHSVGFVLSNVNQTSKNAKSVYGMEVCCALTPKIRMCMIYPQEDCVSYIRKSTISPISKAQFLQ